MGVNKSHDMVGKTMFLTTSDGNNHPEGDNQGNFCAWDRDLSPTSPQFREIKDEGDLIFVKKAREPSNAPLVKLVSDFDYAKDPSRIVNLDSSPVDDAICSVLRVSCPIQKIPRILAAHLKETPLHEPNWG